MIGKEGVEQMFETQLRGSPRVRKLEVDSRGRLVRVLSDRPANAGNDVQLAMDLEIQRVTEDSLEQGMKSASGIRTAERGRASRPTRRTAARRSCSTRATARSSRSLPRPTSTSGSSPTASPPRSTRRSTHRTRTIPLIDRALQGQYAPGSTWKLVTAIAALETGTVTPEDVIQDRGEIRYENQIFKNAGGLRHGGVALQTAIAVSSDVYFYIQGLRLWEIYAGEDGNLKDEKRGSAIQNVARRFGFSRPTRVGLGSELVGRIPDEKFKNKFNKNNPDPFTRDWLPGDSINLAVGQGDLLVTPMQMAVAYAAFANGGTRYVPRARRRASSLPAARASCVSSCRSAEAKAPVKPEIRAPIMAGLKDAVLPGGIGTAARAFSGYGGIEVAGKTGTAEVFGKQDTSVFVGIVNPDPPLGADEPQYVVAVFVEQGGDGGSVAAPIARRIAERAER